MRVNPVEIPAPSMPGGWCWIASHPADASGVYELDETGSKPSVRLQSSPFRQSSTGFAPAASSSPSWTSFGPPSAALSPAADAPAAAGASAAGPSWANFGMNTPLMTEYLDQCRSRT
jgi:hypothetical protein